MCSVDPDQGELDFQSEEMKNLRINGIPDGECKKCQSNGHLVYHGKDFICQSCFIIYSNHKFRSTIGKAHVVKHGDKVLVAFSGGAASTAMLHMLLQGLADSSHKRIKFHPSLIFINELSEIQEIQDIIKKMLASGLPCYFTSLNTYFKNNDSKESMYQEIVKIEDEIDEMFKTSELLDQALAKLPSLSTKEDFVKNIRLRLLSEIGKILGFDKIFVGDTSSSLAVEMLTGLAIGRGSQIPNFVSFVDNRYCLPILRPLREFQLREISIYNQYFALTSTKLPSLNREVNNKGSIKKLTETFVNGLQEDFPATVPTIFRTGDKICSSTKATDNEERCVLCLSSLDIENNNKFRALDALLLSQELCKPLGTTKNTEKCDSDCSATNSCCKDRISNKLKLCYACLCTAQEAKDNTFIPAVILEKEKREKLKRNIEEFLIQEDDS